MAVFLQQSWAQIGIPVAVDLQTGGMLRQLRNQGKLGMFRGSWIADYPDAENYLSLYYSKNFAPNGPNYTHFKNELFEFLWFSSSVKEALYLSTRLRIRNQKYMFMLNY